MKRATILIIIFAYFIGTLDALVNGGLTPPVPEFEGDMTKDSGISSWVKKVPGVGIAIEFLGFLLGAVKYTFNLLTLSFAPLKWDLGWSVLTAFFKVIWSVMLAYAYIDVGGVVLKHMSRLISAIGNWIPFT